VEEEDGESFHEATQVIPVHTEDATKPNLLTMTQGEVGRNAA